jgi:hypothetical protein
MVIRGSSSAARCDCRICRSVHGDSRQAAPQLAERGVMIPAGPAVDAGAVSRLVPSGIRTSHG